MSTENDIRLIAFYLPQFHPIPENDLWWGKGFTEWTNVAVAKPVFPGHYQPHIPADLGFYDLRLAEVREEQAYLAKAYGIYGFCYYYYYFNGKRLLNRPLDENLRTGKPDFPFCICWANENWTRRWDGRDNEVLIEQKHSIEDDEVFIRQLIPVLKDKRYIRINNKLLLLIYRVERFPDINQTADIWRNIIKKELNEELFLCAVNNFVKEIDPQLIGFDATVQFPLDFHPDCRILPQWSSNENNLEFTPLEDYLIMDYKLIMERMVNIKKPSYKFFRGVFPAWDNTPRRQNSSAIFINSSPDLYSIFLKITIGLTNAEHTGDEKLIFINAWNEWAEGAHLEPDKKYGLQWLEKTREALESKEDYLQLMDGLTKIITNTVIPVSVTDSTRNNNIAFEEKSNEQYQATNYNDEADIIRRSSTFRAGKIIMWLPIQVYNLIKRFKTGKNG